MDRFVIRCHTASSGPNERIHEYAAEPIAQAVWALHGRSWRHRRRLAGPTFTRGEVTKPIEVIGVGDRVLAWNDAMGGQVVGRVQRLFRHPNQPTLQVVLRADESDDCVDCTPDHPFWVEAHGWVAARRLKPGDRLRCSNGARVVYVVRTDFEPQFADVFNIEVAGAHNYHVGRHGVLVHNMSSAPRPPTVGQRLAQWFDETLRKPARSDLLIGAIRIAGLLDRGYGEPIFLGRDDHRNMSRAAPDIAREGAAALWPAASGASPPPPPSPTTPIGYAGTITLFHKQALAPTAKRFIGPTGDGSMSDGRTMTRPPTQEPQVLFSGMLTKYADQLPRVARDKYLATKAALQKRPAWAEPREGLHKGP